jgi:hypothetical protein
MNTTSESPVLLIGLAQTGKTNFLVGLDIVLDEQSDPDGLFHSDFAPDREYVQPLREQWLQGKEFEHTNRQVPPPPHQLLVVHRKSGRRVAFDVPDLAGETFDAHFVTRSLPADFGRRVIHCQGVILFVHCDHNADHVLLEHVELLDKAPAEHPAEASVTVQTEWELENASKQVKLVDLLQFIAELRTQQQPLPIAVVISAWDLIENAPAALSNELPKDPALFLAKRWPLLNQYLQANSFSFSSRVFGVSARGGGTSPQEITRLTSMQRPVDRIRIVDGKHRSNDLTRPVRWLLGFLGAN